MSKEQILERIRILNKEILDLQAGRISDKSFVLASNPSKANELASEIENEYKEKIVPLVKELLELKEEVSNYE